jgi:hypothetical protein
MHCCLFLRNFHILACNINDDDDNDDSNDDDDNDDSDSDSSDDDDNDSNDDNDNDDSDSDSNDDKIPYAYRSKWNIISFFFQVNEMYVKIDVSLSILML